MNIAYCISAYTDPEQCGRLIKALHRDAHFFIHLDKKVELSSYKGVVERILLCGTGQLTVDNVHYVKQLPIKWATLSQVGYQMEMLKAACEFSVDFDYIFMLSAFDYPLWPNSKICSFLNDRYGSEFIEGMEVQKTFYLDNLQREIRPSFEIRCIGAIGNWLLRGIIRRVCKALKIRKKRSLQLRDGTKLTVYKGSDYFCITKRLAEYALSYYSAHPEIKRYFRNTFAPSETLIHTIVFNSPFKRNCICCVPPYKGLKYMTPLHYISGTDIKVLCSSDYDQLIDSGKMFARKFRTGVSEDLIHRIEVNR